MKALQRWLDDPTTSAQLKRELSQLEAARVPYDTEAGWGALQSAIDAGAPGLTSAATTGTTAGWTPIAVKLVLLAAIGGGVIGAVRWLGAEPAHAPARASVSSQPWAAPDSAQHAQPIAPEAPAPVAEPKQEPERRTKPKLVPDSRREIAQLARIRALLKRDPAAAHRAIVAAQREFPDGLLAEEREGLDAIALARSGQRERARKQAQRFIERYPKSPLRPQLERLLAGESL